MSQGWGWGLRTSPLCQLGRRDGRPRAPAGPSVQPPWQSQGFETHGKTPNRGVPLAHLSPALSSSLRVPAEDETRDWSKWHPKQPPPHPRSCGNAAPLSRANFGSSVLRKQSQGIREERCWRPGPTGAFPYKGLTGLVQGVRADPLCWRLQPRKGPCRGPGAGLDAGGLLPCPLGLAWCNSHEDGTATAIATVTDLPPACGDPQSSRWCPGRGKEPGRLCRMGAVCAPHHGSCPTPAASCPSRS